MNFKIKAIENIRILAISAVVSLGGLYIANAFTGPGVPPDQRNSDQPYSTIAGVTTQKFDISSVPAFRKSRLLILNTRIPDPTILQNMANACEAQYGASARTCSTPNSDSLTLAYKTKLESYPQSWLYNRTNTPFFSRGSIDGEVSPYSISPAWYDEVGGYRTGSYGFYTVHEDGTWIDVNAYTNQGILRQLRGRPNLNAPVLCCYK